MERTFTKQRSLRTAVARPVSSLGVTLIVSLELRSESDGSYPYIEGGSVGEGDRADVTDMTHAYLKTN